MKNAKLTLLIRAKMSTLNAIRNFGDTDAEPHFQRAAVWLNRAIAWTALDQDGVNAAVMNAAAHLQLASTTLGFEPVQVRC